MARSWTFRIVDPAVIALLRSPLHRWLSHNTMLLEHRGRHSSRALLTPVSFHRSGGEIHAFAHERLQWWRNVHSTPSVRLLEGGVLLCAQAQVEREDKAQIGVRFATFLRAVTRDASVSGVRMDRRGEPNAADIAAAALTHVWARFDVD